MRTCLLLFLLALGFINASAQELFVFSEPASNMPAKSLSLKFTARYSDSKYENYFRQRYTPEMMFGFSKHLMVHVSSTFSDFYWPSSRWESGKVYAKWRFYSSDDVHKHFRMAAFAEGAYSKSPFTYGDINLEGDNSGVQGGLIATQLVNKLAVSATASLIRVFAPSGSEHSAHEDHSLQSVYYSLSAGYLLLPRSYTGYKQPNINLYFEMIGMRGLGKDHYMVDLAPAVQLILNSNFKINAGYRFQATGNMDRIGERSWVFGLERTFLGALENRKKQ